MRRLTGRNNLAPGERRRPPNRGLRNGVQATAVLAIGTIMICGPVWLWRSGVIEDGAARLQFAAIERLADFGLSVENIVISGRVETESAEALAALGVRRGSPIFAVEPEAARERIELLPWVARATVERRLPNELRVQIEEHLPLAIWQHERRIRMINAEGGVIDVEPPRRFSHLPVVVGPDAPDHALGLIRLLGTEPDLARRVAAAVRVGGRRWNLEFADGISVSLPEHEAVAAWRRLATLVREDDLFDKSIIAIDLRLFPGKLVIRRAPGTTIASDQKGKET
ncbi:MAG: FtsQ-type POTRA domain-containing protein [Alphaproteobacteria bacterium]|nr:FtsQ-type POTRA domain-containing protein [Alphaproteobacteria bacterium]